MGDVFLLGAGFSKAISGAMPLLPDLGQEVWGRVKGLVSTSSSPLFGNDFEMWLTYLSQSHPWLSEAENLRNHALFLDLSRVIAEVLKECQDKATQGGCPGWLADLVGWWHRQQAAVITLNYDTLVERAANEAVKVGSGPLGGLECSAIYPITLTPAAHRIAGVFGNGTEPSFQIFKLHGSVNWFYSGSSSFYGESIYYVPVCGWNLSGQGRDRERSHAEAVTDKVPFIVPPLMEKVLYFQHETLRSLWEQAAAALRGASRVFCLGYSLPPTDITMRFFLHANRPKTRKKVEFYLVNLPGNNVVEHFRSLLPGYKIDGQFVCVSSIPMFTEALVRGQL